MKRGGTLNLNSSNTDFDFVDLGLAYDTIDWEMLYTTQMLLVNFPEKSGQAGSQLYPEGAAAFPTISKDGKTYVVPHPPGPEVQRRRPGHCRQLAARVGAEPEPEDGVAVGVNDQFQKVVVGGDDFLAGKTQHISGITAKG